MTSDTPLHCYFNLNREDFCTIDFNYQGQHKAPYYLGFCRQKNIRLNCRDVKLFYGCIGPFDTEEAVQELGKDFIGMSTEGILAKIKYVKEKEIPELFGLTIVKIYSLKPKQA